MLGIGVPELIVLTVYFFPVILVSLVSFWRILNKAGFNPWISLGVVFPATIPLLLLFVAFAPWPALAERSK